MYVYYMFVQTDLVKFVCAYVFSSRSNVLSAQQEHPFGIDFSHPVTKFRNCTQLCEP